MANDESDFRVAFLMANEGVERVELVEPWKAVVEAGGYPTLLAPEFTEVQTFDHLDKADQFTVDRAVGTPPLAAGPESRVRVPAGGAPRVAAVFRCVLAAGPVVRRGSRGPPHRGSRGADRGAS